MILFEKKSNKIVPNALNISTKFKQKNVCKLTFWMVYFFHCKIRFKKTIEYSIAVVNKIHLSVNRLIDRYYIIDYIFSLI